MQSVQVAELHYSYGCALTEVAIEASAVLGNDASAIETNVEPIADGDLVDSHQVEEEDDMLAGASASNVKDTDEELGEDDEEEVDDFQLVCSTFNTQAWEVLDMARVIFASLPTDSLPENALAKGMPAFLSHRDSSHAAWNDFHGAGTMATGHPRLHSGT
jgi:hypothetical protein